MRTFWIVMLVLSAAAAHAGDAGKGKETYAKSCASCHGKDGKGNAGMTKAFKVDLAALDMTDAATLDQKDEALAAVVNDGKGKMPAFKSKLSADQTGDVLAYIRSLAQPAGEAEAPAADAAAAGAGAPPEKVTMDKTGKLAPVGFPHAAHAKKTACADCHGGDAPLFEQKRSEAGYKMADMYKGQNCGACHDGKKAFAAKTACMKCHKK